MVVVGIIAILAAILFPVFAGVKAAALKTTCASNLHQIGLAINMYVQDQNGAYPSGTDGVTESLAEVHGASLLAQMKPYVKDPQIWHCPADDGFNVESGGYGGPESPGPSAHPTAFAEYGTSYEYLLSGFGVLGPAFLESEIVFPSQEGLMFDFDGAWHSRELQVPVGAGLDQWGEYQEKYWYNELYFDGHVKYVPDSEMRRSRY